jgi:hypothetical protein
MCCFEPGVVKHKHEVEVLTALNCRLAHSELLDITTEPNKIDLNYNSFE